jgi:hypothetical protein
MNAMPAHRKRERWEEGTDRWSNVKPRNWMMKYVQCSISWLCLSTLLCRDYNLGA